MQDVDTGQYKHTDKHRQQSSGLKRQVVLYVATNVMEKPLLPSSTLKMQSTSSSKTLVTTYETTWYHNSKDHNKFFTAMETSYLIYHKKRYIHHKKRYTIIKLDSIH
jgi:hypothetical protein